MCKNFNKFEQFLEVIAKKKENENNNINMYHS